MQKTSLQETTFSHYSNPVSRLKTDGDTHTWRKFDMKSKLQGARLPESGCKTPIYDAGHLGRHLCLKNAGHRAAAFRRERTSSLD